MYIKKTYEKKLSIYLKYIQKNIRKKINENNRFV